MEITITIKDGAVTKTFKLNQTAEAVKNDKTGKTSLAHFQPAENNKVVKPFSKLYVDTLEYGKKDKAS